MYKYHNAKKFVDDVNSKTIGIPYKRIYYSNADVRKMFKKLQNVNFQDRVQLDRYYKIRNIDFKPIELLYIGRPHLLLHKPEDYNDFNNLSDMFQEENRLKCKLFSEHSAPEKYFYKNLHQLAHACLKKYRTITPKFMRETMYEAGVKECTSFRPLNLIYTLQLFNAKSVLDFSAGWGDRLLACLATGTRYIGVDPNELLHPKYAEMIDFFAPSKKSKYTMLESTIQDAKLPKEKVDLVFTSPPYFDMEVYSGRGKVTQKNEKEWFSKFLKVAIKKCNNQLNNGGHMVLVINQRSGEKYIRQMVDYINTHITDLHYMGVISYTKTTRLNPQPMWIWAKGKKIPEEIYNPPMVISDHEHDGKNYKVFRDDYLIGGTKQRAVVPYMETKKEKTFIYSGPVTGYAQIALAYSAFLTKKNAVLFLEKPKSRTLLTQYASMFANAELKEINNGNLKKLQEMGKDYQKKNSDSVVFAFGGYATDYINILTTMIKRAIPSGLKPKRIWLVGGSAAILNSLYNVFPTTEFIVVRVGRKIWPDQIDAKRTTLITSDEYFTAVAEKQPPYTTVATYDAKLWKYFIKDVQEGDYIWNVGKDLSKKYM
jgi:tRNA1(Val) A37 N6-methylase TrmN6